MDIKIEDSQLNAQFQELVKVKVLELFTPEKRDALVKEALNTIINAPAKYGVALEMWVQSAGNIRTISFSNEVAGHGPLNPIIRLGFASFIAKSVDE